MTVTVDLIKKWIDDPKEYFDTWPEALAALCNLCEEEEVGLNFIYNDGWTQDPILDDEGEVSFSEPYRKDWGWIVGVGMRGFINKDDESDFVFSNPGAAAIAGLRLFLRVLEGDDEEAVEALQ